ncbi:MAG TPA: DNA repair protein RadC [Xanthomonadaceae bacterium]|nr:DNA repair protein RadC [Xanthomonadaceae bacterium]
MSPLDLPAHERPRERLLQHGAAALTDAEILAVMLGTGTRGRPVMGCARDLLAGFGGVRGLLDAPAPTLLSRAGLGPAKASQLLASLELARRYLAEGLRREGVVARPEDAQAFLAARLRGRLSEVFCALFLDTRHRVIACEDLFHGTIDGASVHPREVVRACLRHNAAALIVAHNHPSGVAEPSAADRSITRRLVEALSLVDVRLLDHFVIGDGPPVSLASRGWI